VAAARSFDPLWPAPAACLTTHFLVSKKWFPRNFSLRGSRLYYSDGKHGHPDTAEGTLAFMKLNPSPDGRYCVDLQGMHAPVAHLIFLYVTLLRRLQRRRL
jgi:hypothetical protein